MKLHPFQGVYVTDPLKISHAPLTTTLGVGGVGGWDPLPLLGEECPFPLLLLAQACLSLGLHIRTLADM